MIQAIAFIIIFPEIPAVHKVRFPPPARHIIMSMLKFPISFTSSKGILDIPIINEQIYI